MCFTRFIYPSFSLRLYSVMMPLSHPQNHEDVWGHNSFTPNVSGQSLGFLRPSSLLFFRLQTAFPFRSHPSSSPLSIPAKIKKPMMQPVRNKINLSKNHTNIVNNSSKNTQKPKIIPTEKVPRIPHIYIQNSYELLAGLTNL